MTKNNRYFVRVTDGAFLKEELISLTISEALQMLKDFGVGPYTKELRYLECGNFITRTKEIKGAIDGVPYDHGTQSILVIRIL